MDSVTHLARGHGHRGKILGVEKNYRVRNADLIRAGAEWRGGDGDRDRYIDCNLRFKIQE